MRIVILSSSLYSETACAMAARLSALGYVPSGALVLSTLNRKTLVRKLGQWGVRDVARYARAKLTPQGEAGASRVHNSHLKPMLERGNEVFRSLREVGGVYGFPVTVCKDQNGYESVARLREWSPDLMVFTGGNILRKSLLQVPRLGVLNAHLGLLPEIRGMSSPEWSLLKDVPAGVTIHYIDEGIDTGPVLQRCEFPDTGSCESLADLRYRLIAFGVEKMAEVVARLDQGAISAAPQLNTDRTTPDYDHQFFVMHEWLRAQAAQRLAKGHTPFRPRDAERVGR